MTWFDDIAMVLGFGLLVTGAYLTYPAAGWCVAGLALIAIGAGGQILRTRNKDNDS